MIRWAACPAQTSSTLGDVVPVVQRQQLPISKWIFHTLDSYHAPLIVSAGTDQELGLLEPDDVGTPGAPTSAIWRGRARRRGCSTSRRSSNPGNSPLADNLTNHTTGVGN